MLLAVTLVFAQKSIKLTRPGKGVTLSSGYVVGLSVFPPLSVFRFVLCCGPNADRGVGGCLVLFTEPLLLLRSAVDKVEWTTVGVLPEETIGIEVWDARDWLKLGGFSIIDRADQILGTYQAKNTGSFEFFVPVLDKTDESFYIVVYLLSDRQVNSQSEQFTIKALSQTVYVTAPNPASAFKTGEPVFISWQTYNIPGMGVRVLLFLIRAVCFVFCLYCTSSVAGAKLSNFDARPCLARVSFCCTAEQSTMRIILKKQKDGVGAKLASWISVDSTIDVVVVGDVPNTGNHTWVVPLSIVPGPNYFFQVIW